MEVEAESIVMPKDILDIKEDILEGLLNGCDLHNFFRIKSTKDYLAYEDSMIRSKHPLISNNYIPSFGKSRNWSREDAGNAINEAIGYQYYPDGNNAIISISFDEIMHNTTIAFPTMILVKKDLESI